MAPKTKGIKKGTSIDESFELGRKPGQREKAKEIADIVKHGTHMKRKRKYFSMRFKRNKPLQAKSKPKYDRKRFSHLLKIAFIPLQFRSFQSFGSICNFAISIDNGIRHEEN